MRVSPRRSVRPTKATKKCKDCPNCNAVHDLVLYELDGGATVSRAPNRSIRFPSKTNVASNNSPIKKSVKSSGKVSRVLGKGRNAVSRSRRRGGKNSGELHPCKCGKKYNQLSNLKRHLKTSCVLIFGIKKRKVGKPRAQKPVPLPIKLEPNVDVVVKKPSSRRTHLCECGIKFESTDDYKIHKIESCEVEPAQGVGFQLRCLCSLYFNSQSSYYRHRRSCQEFLKGLAPFSGPVPMPKIEKRTMDESSPRFPTVTIKPVKTEPNEEPEPLPDSSTVLPKIKLEPLDGFAIVAPTEEKIDCECGKSFLTAFSRRAHLRFCSAKKLLPKPVFRCFCGAEFNKKLPLRRHQIEVHGKTSKPMKVLKKVAKVISKKGSKTVGKIVLKKGVKRAKVAGQRVKCVCGKEFANRAFMSKHVRNTCGFDLRCPMCNKNHPIKPLLYFHMKNEHGIIPETVYPFRPEDQVAEDPSI